MSAELEDQLAAYGAWLGVSTGATMTRPDRPIQEAGHGETEVGARRARGSSKLWLWAAAVLIVAVGIGGLVVGQRDGGRPPAAAQHSAPVDPEAQLYVLPTDSENLEFGRGESSTARPDPVDSVAPQSPMIVFGTETDGGFSGVATAMVLDTLPDARGNGEWTQVNTASGPAFVSTGLFPNQGVARQRDDTWLLVTGATGEQELLDLLSQVGVDATGAPTIENGSQVVIETISQDPTAASYSTFYEITDPASGITFEVETATFPSATILGTYTPNPITATTVNGTAAWILTRSEPSGATNTGVAWRATPNRVIAVGAEAPLEAVRAMAERMRPVTEDEWLGALPGASIQN